MELLEDEMKEELEDEDDFPSWVGLDRKVNEVLYTEYVKIAALPARSARCEQGGSA